MQINKGIFSLFIAFQQLTRGFEMKGEWILIASIEVKEILLL